MPHAHSFRTDAPGELFARILSTDGPTYVGIVRDQVALERSTRALVEFAHVEAPLLTVGSRVWVDFAGGSGRAAPDSMASVIFRSEREGFRRYELSFGANDEAVRELVERRRTDRVEPGAGTRVQFRGRGGAGRHEGTVENVSTAGLAFGTQLENEPSLIDVDEVELALFLEPDDAPILVTGRLVWRRLVASKVLYGVEFEPGQTPGFGSAQERIDRYLRGRGGESGVHRRAS